MKKLITLIIIASSSLIFNSQASLGERIEQDGIGWIIGSWSVERDGNKLEISYKWAVKDHIISSHLKMPGVEGFSVIGINPKSGDVEQSGFNSRGSKITGKWGPKGDMPMLKYTSINDADETQTAAVAFRKVDEKTIEVQIFSADDSGKVGDSADYTFEMTKVKE
ncbi:MAG: hypothetical protein EVB09_07535 [Verrucomicrobiaceae bacterium]|nr:MAG: hypothetical protein EVB09_07535 [Verrucomicrobiaceae bacterium]